MNHDSAGQGPHERPVRPLVERLKSHYGHHYTTTRYGMVVGEHHDFARHPLVGEAIAEIKRAWAARDAAVADLEAHAAAEVRRAVAAERERWELHLSAVRQLAETHAKRGDDCGMLARTFLDTLKAMTP